MIKKLDYDSKTKTLPYILSNEVGLEATYSKLKKAPFKNSAFHIGFSCWHNFDLIALRNSCGALLIDKSSEVHTFMEETKKTMLISKNRFHFIDLMTQEIAAHEGTYIRKGEKEWQKKLAEELTRKESVFSSDPGFSYIQALYQHERIFHIRKDITDVEGFSCIQKWIEENTLVLDTLYVSNIGDWLACDDELLEDMKKALDHILLPETFVVDSSDRFKDRTPSERGLMQKVILGSDYHPAHLRKISN